LPFCEKFELTNEEYSYLRNLLNEHHSLKQTELQEKTISMPIGNLFSYLIFTYANNSRISATENVVEAQYRSNKGIYYLVINDYIFSLYLQKPLAVFPETLNTNSKKVRITILSDREFRIISARQSEKYFKEISLKKFSAKI
jgi:hypothetical protein